MLGTTRRVLMAVGIALLPCFLHAQACDEIRTFDSRNATIDLSPRDDGSRQDGESLTLQNGSAFLSDNPSSPNSHDWQVEILVDRVTHLQPSMEAHVVVLEETHLSGTGARDYVLVFGCRHGSLARLFQFSSEGVSLKHLDGGMLELYEPLWKRSDPHCCPSRHLTLRYRWDAGARQFDQVARSAGNGFETIPDKR